MILLNDKPVHQWKFPGGEIGVKVYSPAENDLYHINWKGIPTSDDLMVLLQTVDALSLAGIASEKIAVYIPYLPYARQDRACHEGESFSLDVFCQVLGTIEDKIGMICVVDPHSEVSQNLLTYWFGDKLWIVPQHLAAGMLPKYDWIIGADAGSAKKAALVQPLASHLYLTKTREDGKVTVHVKEEDVELIRGTACIVDDICDGGATFIAAAKALLLRQPHMTKLDLYVTHGIFSQGVDKLLELFDNIYCLNLMSADPEVAQKVKVI